MFYLLNPEETIRIQRRGKRGRQGFVENLENLLWSVFVENETSTEAGLAPDSCTVEYKQLQMFTLSVQSCSTWPKPMFLSFTTPTTPVREYY